MHTNPSCNGKNEALDAFLVQCQGGWNQEIIIRY